VRKWLVGDWNLAKINPPLTSSMYVGALNGFHQDIFHKKQCISGVGELVSVNCLPNLKLFLVKSPKMSHFMFKMALSESEKKMMTSCSF